MIARESSAVMAQRKLTKASLDMFPTPPWATRALIEDVLKRRGLLDSGLFLNCWEPSCGKGHMAIPLIEEFGTVFASDVHDWGFGDRRDLDFCNASSADCPVRPHWIIGNPPFKLGEQFFHRAYELVEIGCALLLRLQWIEGEGRFARIFGGDRKPAVVAPFAERVPMIEGVWDPDASSATAYAWFVWTKDRVDESIVAPIPPNARSRYSRLTDMALATPGEAARRKAAKKAAELAGEPQPRLV